MTLGNRFLSVWGVEGSLDCKAAEVLQFLLYSGGGVALICHQTSLGFGVVICKMEELA